ncbi:MAG TPA: histidine kinase [Ktedonobacterales bacterium]|nr:histidine kinase [Ktedonobacterales bacterium]
MSSAVNDTTSQASAIPAPATPVAITSLRNFSQGIGSFWQGITYAFLLIVLVATFVQQPALLRQPRGWAILALSAVFGAWYYVAFTRLIDVSHSDHWQALMGRRLPPSAWRGFVVWAVAFALTLGLYALDHNFMWMLWSVYGVSFAVWPLPYALALFAPTALAIFATEGWLPTNWQPISLVWFAVSVGMFCIYTAMAYLPFILLRGRFERERMFTDLETSHRALAEAHRQLEVASARDREFVALRERGRIARDMHDTLGHSLALIAVKLDAAQRLRTVDGPRADHEIAATQGIARAALAELRAALAELRAALPEQPSLGEALARAAREAGERAGWRVTYDLAPDLGALDDAAYAALLRVGAEALANAESHARAHNVTLTLVRDACDLVLRVQDDGVGVLTTNPPLARMVTRQIGAARMVAIGTPVAPASADASALSAKLDDWAVATERAQRAERAEPIGAGESDAASERNANIDSPPGHYGITGMRERMTEVGGRFSIGPVCDGGGGGEYARGTVVEARVPARGF